MDKVPERSEQEADQQARITVTVDDEHLDSFQEVIDVCGTMGLHVEQSLDVLGIAIGTVSRGKMQRLRQVPGVRGVEEEAEVQIAPPESGVQ